MTEYDRNLIKNMWARVVGREFQLDDLIAGVRFDGGHDMSNLANDDLANLFLGRFSGDWKEVRFSFSEVLFYYDASTDEEDFTDAEIVHWAFSALVLADVMDYCAEGTRGFFPSCIKCLYFYCCKKSKMTDAEAVYISQRLLHGDRHPPEHLVFDAQHGF